MSKKQENGEELAYAHVPYGKALIRSARFKISTRFQPRGDQAAAIEQLIRGFDDERTTLKGEIERLLAAQQELQSLKSLHERLEIIATEFPDLLDFERDGLLPGDTGDVGDHAPQLHVHLGERLLHVLGVRGGQLDQAVAMPEQGAHGTDRLRRASFRPPETVCAVRSLLRHRDRLVQLAATHTQHLQKALTQMNLQLHHVLSDLTGVTGLVSMPAVERAVRDSVPRGTEDLNMRALRKGYEYGRELVAVPA